MSAGRSAAGGGAAATIRVRLPAMLRPLAGDSAELRVRGSTVGEVLGALGRAHPGLGARLLGADGRPRRYVMLFLNGEDVRSLGGAEAPVRDGDEVMVVPAIAGGAPCR